MEDLPVKGAFFIAFFGALSQGCGPSTGAKHALEGSLSVVMDLGWDECTLDPLSPGEISVRFIRNQNGAMNTPLKIVWAQAGQDLITPSTIDLAEMRPDDPNRQRSTLSRNVLDDSRTVFPLLIRGKMTFFDQIRPDATVKGQLNLTFENGIDFANGRTVFGPFTAKVLQ